VIHSTTGKRGVFCVGQVHYRSIIQVIYGPSKRPASTNGCSKVGHLCAASSKNRSSTSSTCPEWQAVVYLYLPSGEELWRIALPSFGSVLPMRFAYKGCTALVFVATGSRFMGYGDNGDAIRAYKLSSCQFSD
jgi:hypothetical protein